MEVLVDLLEPSYRYGRFAPCGFQRETNMRLKKRWNKKEEKHFIFTTIWLDYQTETLESKDKREMGGFPSSNKV